METTHWKKISKRYFHGDPARTCFIEKNSAISGTPLWPKDPLFQPEAVETALKEVRKILKKSKGLVFQGHIPLQPDRETDPENISVLLKPRPLKTTFVSGFLFPKSSIQESRIGFYPHQGSTPLLAEITQDMQGVWLATNLGYFLTKRLIVTEKEGGLSYSHNSRHPAEEHLQPGDNAYLGGFFLRNADSFEGYPPHFETAGCGVLRSGKPVVIDKVTLRGGVCHLDDLALKWNTEAVNPSDSTGKPVVLYTPSFRTPATAKAIQKDQWREYRSILGNERINIVIINAGTGIHPRPKIAYVRDGSLLQPAGGIVLSLDRSWKNKIPAGTSVRFEFEPWFDEKTWGNLACFYEGLMPLPAEGEPDFEAWLHPHACLTQETYVPNHCRREPRAVLVQTPRYFGAFCFSGRYEYSIGVSLKEMGPLVRHFVRKMKPGEEIEKIVSLDGGSGAKLCLVQSGNVKPLSWVAPGTRNRLGDPNGNTYSCLMLNIAS